MNETQNSNVEIDSNEPKKRPLIYGILCMVFSSLCVCFGQMFWKLWNKENLLFLAIGFVFYIAGALAMLFSYRFGKLSQLQPILSLNYPISILIAALVFGEMITVPKIIAILFITMGVVLIAWGKKSKQ